MPEISLDDFYDYLCTQPFGENYVLSPRDQAAARMTFAPIQDENEVLSDAIDAESKIAGSEEIRESIQQLLTWGNLFEWFQSNRNPDTEEAIKYILFDGVETALNDLSTSGYTIQITQDTRLALHEQITVWILEEKLGLYDV